MMGSSFDDDDENQFFDAHDNIVLGSDLCSDPEIEDSAGACDNFQFDVWAQNPSSVQERRSKFFDWMGVNVREPLFREESVSSPNFHSELDRIISSKEAVMRTSCFDCEFSSSRSSVSSLLDHESEYCGEPSTSKQNFKSSVEIWDGGSDLIEDQLSDSISGSTQMLSQTSLQHSPNDESLQVGSKADPNNSRGSIDGTKKWWLRKLRTFSCVLEESAESENSDSLLGSRTQRVKVRHCGKPAKELSALYLGQDIKAHEGSILTMKFSPDGQYLASAGEDGIVKVWKVVVAERQNATDIPDIDPSCVYFTMNHLSELKQVSSVEKEKNGKARNLKITSDSACVVFPPKVFKLVEKPLHQFEGHCGEVLDLSWSNKNFLLSSSVDKTVRLWRVGSINCLGVFSHNNYVTCVQFNPNDDNYFISGSIDGKVRIWEISRRQVVSWTDIRDIVTAVTYHPDGQGGIVGSMIGCCRFFDISDNQLKLEGSTYLRSKKKSSCKRIIAFQYCPQDPSKVMVTCADSQVRILQGKNVIGKYKGFRNGGNCISASFTDDGKHIISACEDSNVYMWNFINQDNEVPCHPRKVSSCERFQSTSLTVAIPWSGLQCGNPGNNCQFASPLSCFSQGQEFFYDLYYHIKGSYQTWPEENLPPASFHQDLIPSMHRSESKFLRACLQCANGSNAWGLVILTASWDGRIKSYHNYGLPRPH